jgi:hypothetical protein
LSAQRSEQARAPNEHVELRPLDLLVGFSGAAVMTAARSRALRRALLRRKSSYRAGPMVSSSWLVAALSRRR